VTSRGFYLETVQFNGYCAFDYRWQGDRHYLAVHDLKLIEGEAVLDTIPKSTVSDLRERLTFVPSTCVASGWSSLAPRENSYTALTFDPDMVAQELELTAAGRDPQPMLYFHDADLGTTLRKMQSLLKVPGPLDMLHLETLGLLAAVQLDRLQRGPVTPGARPSQLTARQARLVRSYIDEHLAHSLTLTELAALVKLSRFHFARAFKATFGTAPRQYVLARRVERARTMLLTTSLHIAEIAGITGFGGPERFASVFRQHTRCSPTQFRRRGS
jgi:AraC family transcriptional regulator